MRQLLKETVRRILNACGFEITRRATRPATWAGVLDHISESGFKPWTVFDIGVADGTFTLYEAFPDAIHLLVEPLEEFEDALRDIALKYKAEYVMAAASDRLGTVTINVDPVIDGSSILVENEGSQSDSIPRQVPAVTIDSLCDERDLIGPYVIKVDAEGAELLVLGGAKKTLEDTERVILEVLLFGFYRNSPQLYDVVSYMKDHGFVVYDIFGNQYRPLDGALAWIDMAFVKEGGRFRRHHSYATREQLKDVAKRTRDKLGALKRKRD